MYYITGADGKVYGPVPLDILQKWIAEGRVNSQTRLRVEGADEWKPASEIPEVSTLLKPPGPPPVGTTPSAPPGNTTIANSSLAVSSLVLGIVSYALCLGPLTGIPAIICGHMARSRIQRFPAVYTGAGMALAGLIMGYVSLFLMLVILPALLLPALAKTKDKAESIDCIGNLKQVGLSFKLWAIDRDDQFPFNVSTNQGGTMELSFQGQDGVDPKGYLHLMVMSNELSTPKILVCPSDTKKAANDWSELSAANVSYEIMSGTNVTEANPLTVLGMCPVHGHVLTADGAVQQFRKSEKRGRR